MCKNGHDFLGFALLDQGVVNDNVLLPRHTKKVRIAVSASLTSINNIELMKRELQALSQALNTSLQVARLERRKLVEQRQNRNRVDGNHEDLQSSPKQPKVIEELIASLLHNSQKARKDRRSKNESQHLRLQHIHDEKLRGLFVESELLLQDERMVDRGREGKNLLDDYEGKDEDDRVCDLAGKSVGCETEEP